MSSPPPMRLDSNSDTASPESNKLPPIHHIRDDLSDPDVSDDAARSSAGDSSDIEAADHWQEARMCRWGDGSCNHRFVLSRASGQNPLVTVIRKHLQERHPDIFVRDSQGKYLCRWDGCSDPLASVTSVARHILTGRKHLDCGMPCPECKEGSFRMDSLKLHRQRCLARKHRQVHFLPTFADPSR